MVDRWWTKRETRIGRIPITPHLRRNEQGDKAKKEGPNCINKER